MQSGSFLEKLRVRGDRKIARPTIAGPLFTGIADDGFDPVSAADGHGRFVYDELVFSIEILTDLASELVDVSRACPGVS